jgi:ATP-binding cassette subfamily C protein CydC
MNTRQLWPAALGGALSAVSGIGLLATSGWLITRASERPPVLSLCVAIGAVQAFSLGRGLFRYFERLGVHSLSLQRLGQVRLRLFDLLEPRVPGAIGPGAALAGLVSEADAVAQGLAKQVGTRVDFVSSALAGTLLAVLVGPGLGLLVLAGALAMVAAALALSRFSTRAMSHAAEERAALARTVIETVGSAREVIAYEREDLIEQRLAEVRRRSRSVALRAALATGLAKATATAVTGGVLVAVLGAGLAAHDAGRLSGPMLAVAAFATLASLDQCAVLPASLEGISAGRAAAKRIEEVASLPAVSGPAPGAAPAPRLATVPGLASLDRASVALASGAASLKEVSLQLEPGRRLAICGPSGAGKTTIINALMHFVDCSSGQATLGGIDVKDLTRADIAQLAAWLPDETHVFTASVADNLRIARPDATDEDCADAARSAGLADWLASLPDGLATRLGAGGRPLSGGERQRLGMARALLGGGRVILLDEPTARLDPATKDQVLSSLLRAAQDRSLIVVTHEPFVEELVDQVLELADGHVVARRP